MTPIDKRTILRALDAQLTAEIDAATSRAKATAASATHAESRAENDKDTRAIEESYLARGQALRVAELEHDRALLRAIELASMDVVAVGGLVTLEDEDGERAIFVAPAGGGRKVDAVQIVTPHAPLGAALIGKEEGDEVELMIRGRLRIFEIVDLA